MDVFDSSGKRIRLRDQDFLSEGGQGKLYVRQNLVYKLYHDAASLITPAKLRELQLLQHPNVICPLDGLYDKKQSMLGYSMNRVPADAVSLSRLFTSSYWQANGITVNTILELVQNMREVIGFIHSKGFLQVDGNEFNYLVNQNGQMPWFVDVDSYQTPGYPATGIMHTIQDYTRTEFSEETDWYSFAVVAFQLFTGIHPYKGRHPGCQSRELEQRVIAHASVLDRGVTFPSSVREFSTIPRVWLDWFKAVFQKGQRSEPPSGKIRVDVKRKLQIAEDSKEVTIKRARQVDSEVIGSRFFNGEWVIHSKDSLWIGKNCYPWPEHCTYAGVDLTGSPVFLGIEDGELIYYEIDLGKISAKPDTGFSKRNSGMQADKLIVINNLPYIVQADNLLEIEFIRLKNSLWLGVRSSRNILPQSLMVYDGLLVQDAMGLIHFMLPVRNGVMPVIAIPELSGYKLVEARYHDLVVVVFVADQSGQYSYKRFEFEPGFSRYVMTDYADDEDRMNFTVLDKGNNKKVLVSLLRDSLIEMELLGGSGDTRELRRVNDASLSTRMRLIADSSHVAFQSGDAVYQVTVSQ